MESGAAYSEQHPIFGVYLALGLMHDRFVLASIALVAFWLLWLWLAVALYQKVDSRFSGLLPALHSRLQPVTNWTSSWALLKFICKARPSLIDDPSILKAVSVVRWLAVPVLFLWAYVLYFQLQHPA
jgi:hypothetical protein